MLTAPVPAREGHFFFVTICFPVVIILLILAYLLIKEWKKRL